MTAVCSVADVRNNKYTLPKDKLLDKKSIVAAFSISNFKVQLINVNSKMRKNLFYFLTKKGRTFPLVKISFFERY